MCRDRHGGPRTLARTAELTQTLIVRLLKTHLFLHLSSIVKSQQNRIELVTVPGTKQLERAQEISDSGLEATAYGNLGLAKHNLGRQEEAIHCFEQQVRPGKTNYS